MREDPEQQMRHTVANGRHRRKRRGEETLARELAGGRERWWGQKEKRKKSSVRVLEPCPQNTEYRHGIIYTARETAAPEHQRQRTAAASAAVGVGR